MFENQACKSGLKLVGLRLCRNMDETKLAIHHGGSWVGNCYEGGMTKWVNVPRCVSYDGLVKLVEDVAKVDVARYNLQLWSLAFTISGTAHPRIVNDNDVSCMMNADKLLSEIFVSVSVKEMTNYPSVCNDETIDDEENNQLSDIDNSDDSSISYVDRGSHDDEDWHDGVGCGSGSVRGHGCAGPSGFATFSGVSFREDERYSFEPISTEEACLDDGRSYKGRIFPCKKDLKRTLNMYTLKEGFEVWIRRSSKTRYETGCKDGECEFHLRGIKMQKGEYWVIRMFVKDHTCNIDGFHARLRQANSWTVGELLAPKLQVHGHSLKPKDIMVEMQVEHGLHLLYSKAWRAKDHAEASVFGPPEESFKLLPAYCHRLEEYTVRPIDSVNFNVKDGNKDGLVNLSEKTCSRAKFEVDNLPCTDTLAAIRYAKKPLPDYCRDCYKTTSWIEAYAETIFPVGHPNDWNIFEDVQSKVVLSPPFRAQA
ncbi:hypothetical protein Ddye_004700 [Dipteronia dyeriana]|uniref:Transposase MuDR plant domain-containing protein n=1 Tax=Dipteronia dyeriana TaxID=168575 RepID=A0AAE0CNZ9_9ROSI|nr:hypothetical protein Ddye_004700 [Dipteronia dyeriana]